MRCVAHTLASDMVSGEDKEHAAKSETRSSTGTSDCDAPCSAHTLTTTTTTSTRCQRHRLVSRKGHILFSSNKTKYSSTQFAEMDRTNLTNVLKKLVDGQAALQHALDNNRRAMEALVARLDRLEASIASTSASTSSTVSSPRRQNHPRETRPPIYVSFDNSTSITYDPVMNESDLEREVWLSFYTINKEC